MPRIISVGELFDQTWDHYRKHFFVYTGISSIILLSTFFSLIALSFWPNLQTISSLNTTGTSLSATEIFAVLLFLLNVVLTPILSLWILSALTRASKDPMRIPSSPLTPLKEGARFILPTLWVTFLIGLLLTGVNLVSLIPGGLLFLLTNISGVGIIAAAGALFLTLGLVAGFIASIYIYIQLAMAPYIPALTDTRGVAALKTSHTLAKGRFWSVGVRVVFPKLIFFVVGLIILSILSYVARFLSLGVGGLNIDVASRLYAMAQQLLPSLILVFLNPLIVIADILLLQNLLSFSKTPSSPRPLR